MAGKRFVERWTPRTGRAIEAAAHSHFEQDDYYDLLPWFDGETNRWYLTKLVPVTYLVEGTGPGNIRFVQSTEAAL
jgi:hypothetical protein